MTVRHGNGGKTGNVFIGKKTRKALRAYLGHRTDREAALFLSRDGERVSIDALRLMVNGRAKQAGARSIVAITDGLQRVSSGQSSRKD